MKTIADNKNIYLAASILVGSLLALAGCKGGGGGSNVAVADDVPQADPVVIVDEDTGDTTTLVTYQSPIRIFSIDDVQGGFDGSTYATDPTILCMDEACGDAEAFAAKDGTMLYPIDSEFGFVTADFVGAAQKERDDNYTEGWAGNILEGGTVVGLRVSSADTATFKVSFPRGSWVAGLGGNAVKASTEHYVVMEHVASCFETVPYLHADPSTGEQAALIDPETGLLVGDCSIGRLDNELFLVQDGTVTEIPLSAAADGTPNLPPNESTVLNDIAVNGNYAITKKDDGKPLYRWGNMVKRPNDVRVYARLPLPDSWKQDGVAMNVRTAHLIINHQITNNPNDQIRPEDMENEAAIGRLPSVTDLGDGTLVSSRDCYEGDGDFIPTGTVLRNPGFAVDGSDPFAPTPYSEDLRQGYTNAWYTTIDRNPFMWSYENGASDLPSDELGALISGPRWRLKPNKFGQDVPGLEIPAVVCSEVPFTRDNLKYVTGDPATTIIDLLDWDEEEGPSPLASSAGWVAPNAFNTVAFPTDDGAVSINGLPLSADFDFAVYIKGDQKPTSLYNAQLIIEYEEIGG